MEFHTSVERAHARVKIKRLAAEARILRKEAQKHLKVPIIYLSLETERKVRVRKAARIAQLSFAFLRGVPYKSVEPHTRSPVDPSAVALEAWRMIPGGPHGCLNIPSSQMEKPNWETTLHARQFLDAVTAWLRGCG